MILTLWNGAETKSAWDCNSPDFIDDFKPLELKLPCDSVQITYRDHIKIYKDDEEVLDLLWDNDGYIEHDGVYYGDFTISEDK